MNIIVETFLTNDRWAGRKNYSNFEAYSEVPNEFPSNSMLNIIRGDAHAIIVAKIGTGVTGTIRLERLEYDIVEIMLDTEVARTTRQEAIIEVMNNYFIPEVEDDMDALDDDFNRGATPN